MIVFFKFVCIIRKNYILYLEFLFYRIQWVLMYSEIAQVGLEGKSYICLILLNISALATGKMSANISGLKLLKVLCHLLDDDIIMFKKVVSLKIINLCCRMCYKIV